ncbi:MAG: tetratricopeptide repeat protein [Bacteroidales bacterium]|nr:tetratricopeptide repeat protein [Bacteroidales bacterium]
MSDNNLHKIFAPTACVSTERMIDYLDGNLSEKEKNSLEIHMASCDMCRDEFEGLSLMQDNSELDKIVLGLDQKIDEKIKQGGKKSIFFKPIYRIAAVIIILIASGWFLKLYTDSSSKKFQDNAVSQALEETPATENESSISIDSVIALSENNDQKPQLERDRVLMSRKEKIKSEDKSLERSRLLSSEKEDVEEVAFMEEDIAKDDFAASTSKTIIVKEEEPIVESDLRTKNLEENKVNPVIAGATETEKKKETESLDVIENEVVVADNKTTRGSNRRQNKKLAKAEQEEGKQLSNTVAINNFDLAMTQYNQRDYKQAIDLFKKSINQHTRTDEVYYYLAKSYYNTNDPENALSSFNKVIAEQSSPYYEEALWNKSQILLEMNKKKSAINSFNQVKNYKGNYSERAAEILDSLNLK